MHSGPWSASQRTDTQCLCVQGPEGSRIRGCRLSWQIIKSARSPPAVFASDSFPLKTPPLMFIFFYFGSFFWCFCLVFFILSRRQKLRPCTRVHPPVSPPITDGRAPKICRPQCRNSKKTSQTTSSPALPPGGSSGPCQSANID